MPQQSRQFSRSNYRNGRRDAGGLYNKDCGIQRRLSFTGAFFMGLLGNWLVRMAVWMASAAKDITGKLLSIFFPIWLFVTSEFEHSIANMYYIPAGILAKASQTWLDAAISMGVAANSLVPVTLGNIVGGTIFVGVMYWFSYLYKAKKKV